MKKYLNDSISFDKEKSAKVFQKIRATRGKKVLGKQNHDQNIQGNIYPIEISANQYSKQPQLEQARQPNSLDSYLDFEPRVSLQQFAIDGCEFIENTQQEQLIVDEEKTPIIPHRSQNQSIDLVDHNLSQVEEDGTYKNLKIEVPHTEQLDSDKNQQTINYQVESMINSSINHQDDSVLNESVVINVQQQQRLSYEIGDLKLQEVQFSNPSQPTDGNQIVIERVQEYIQIERLSIEQQKLDKSKAQEISKQQIFEISALAFESTKSPRSISLSQAQEHVSILYKKDQERRNRIEEQRLIKEM
eukprot:403363510